MKGLGEECSTKPHKFKSLGAVGIDNPRLEGGRVKRMGNPEPGVKMEANALGVVRTFLRGPASM